MTFKIMDRHSQICFDELISKGHFIKTLNEKYIYYYYMGQLTTQKDDDLNQIIRKTFKTDKEYFLTTFL